MQEKEDVAIADHTTKPNSATSVARWCRNHSTIYASLVHASPAYLGWERVWLSPERSLRPAII